MKKIILIASFFVVPCICFAASSAKKDVKKEPVKKEIPKAAPEAIKTDGSSPAKVTVVDDFEAETVKWKGLTFLTSDDGKGQEETAEDLIKVDINKDEKFVKSGKQSIKIEYAMKNPSENKFAQIGFKADKPMGNNNGVSFWIYKVKGKASLTVTLFDNVVWKKRVSQPIPLNFEGWKPITLSASDFTTAPDFDKVNVVQIIIRGDASFYLDDMRFLKVKADK